MSDASDTLLTDTNPFSDDEVFVVKQSTNIQLSENSVSAPGTYADNTVIVRTYQLPKKQNFASKG